MVRRGNYKDHIEAPTHKILVHQYVDWDRVEERLNHYQNIRLVYSLDFLKECSDREPYYCHYLAWRFGVWKDEGLLTFLDELFAAASLLRGWNKSKKEELRSKWRFDEFWGLIWELQMAKFLAGMDGIKVEWTPNGPDLLVSIDRKERFFLECYVYAKSFGIMSFIQDLCTEIDSRIKVRHSPFLKFSLPKDKDTDDFLNRLFRTVIDKKHELLQEPKDSIILFSVPNVPNFIVYLEGDSLVSPNMSPELFTILNTGDPEAYLKVAIAEAVSNRNKLKQLKGYHPNLLAINYLLSLDYQIASALRAVPNLETSPEIWDAYDSVLITICGINELPSPNKLYFKPKPNFLHPVSKLLSSPNIYIYPWLGEVVNIKSDSVG